MSLTSSGLASGHAVPAAEGVMSVDALRGFDMMWIVGADALGHALHGFGGGGFLTSVALQLDHAPWAGFRFYDLIFPLFVFLIGVSIPFSLGRLVEGGGRGAAMQRIIRRTLLLYLLGLFYYWGMAKGFDQIRWLGVLQRLALCYGFAGLMYVYLRPRGLAGAGVALLAGYWALLTFVPVPGVGPGDYSEGRNLTNWFDKQFLPGFKWDGDHDPEGILSTLPAVASCLLGVFAGNLLKDGTVAPGDKVRRLLIAGVVLLAAGYLWGMRFPIIKKLWTSSFVLVAGGWSALLLAAFYWAIDLRGWRAWAVPFTWIGTNALTIYIVSRLVDFNEVSSRLVGGEIASWLDAHIAPHSSGLVLALTGLALSFLLCRFLYRRQVFLRL